MLESNYSKEVYAHTALPFPADFKNKSPDRLHREISVSGEPGDYRLKVVNVNGKIEANILQKVVNTGIQADNIEDEVVRVKAVLKKPDSGITESHWVTTRQASVSDVQPLNQFRIRGVSRSNVKSQWVYSGIKDSDNETVLFNLLYDLIDILLTTQDNQLDVLLHHIAEDAYRSVIKDQDIYHEFDEFFSDDVEHGLRELFTSLGKQLSELFHEKVMIAPEEFSDFMRTYQLLDQLKQNPGDFFTLLVEHFLEEELDRLIKSTEYSAVLTGPDLVQYLLSDNFRKAHIKQEWLTSTYKILPSDEFVASINDVVKLFSEPIIREECDYTAVEETQKKLSAYKKEIKEAFQHETNEEMTALWRTLILDVFIPIAWIDYKDVLTRHALSDDAKIDAVDTGRSLEVYDDKFQYHNQLMYDLLREIVKGDLGLNHEFEADILDRILGYLDDDKYQLFITTHFYELIDLFSLMNEIVKLTNLKTPHLNLEQKSVVPDERSAAADSSRYVSAVENVDLTHDEHQDVSSSVQEKNQRERLLTEIIESVLESYMSHMLKTREENALRTLDQYEVRRDPFKQLYEYLYTRIRERVARSADVECKFREDLLLDQRSCESPYYFPNIKDLVAIKSGAKREADIFFHPEDRFLIKGKDRVRYALGDVGSEWPIGKFILGVNTLIGKE